MSNLTSHDAAIAACDTVRQAELHFLEMSIQNEYTELSTEMLLAEASWLRASEQFADTVPTTTAGAITKILAVESLLSDIPLAVNSLEIRHLRAVIRFLQRRPTAPVTKRHRAPARAG
ncbi:MAG: hypothetical protein HWD60_11715 [Defluviicoccus sp.]|nr:MAG: hypothetical protein HWD60_11715 [Defluviicoccus sp.]